MIYYIPKLDKIPEINMELFEEAYEMSRHQWEDLTLWIGTPPNRKEILIPLSLDQEKRENIFFLLANNIFWGR